MRWDINPHFSQLGTTTTGRGYLRFGEAKLPCHDHCSMGFGHSLLITSTLPNPLDPRAYGRSDSSGRMLQPIDELSPPSYFTIPTPIPDALRLSKRSPLKSSGFNPPTHCRTRKYFAG